MDCVCVILFVVVFDKITTKDLLACLSNAAVTVLHYLFPCSHVSPSHFINGCGHIVLFGIWPSYRQTTYYVQTGRRVRKTPTKQRPRECPPDVDEARPPLRVSLPSTIYWPP